MFTIVTVPPFNVRLTLSHHHIKSFACLFIVFVTGRIPSGKFNSELFMQLNELKLTVLVFSCFVFVADGVFLKYSSLPNEGFAQIVTKYNGTKSVCWQS
jgi:hypothetical protein